jgi:hypothetical protein
MTPSPKGRRRLYLAILLVAISLVAIQLGAYYDLERFFIANNRGSQNTGNNNTTNVIAVNTLLNFGNSTSKWFNETRIPVGWNFYNLTIYIANGKVDSTYYASPLNEHYINTIDGVTQDGSSFWHLWQFCKNDQAWSYSNIGADGIVLSNGQTAAWYFDSYNDYGPPVLGSRTIVTCSL